MKRPRFDEIESDMGLLDEWEDRYRYVIDLGRAMPSMDAALKTDAARVQGCASQVWLVPHWHEGRLDFAGDSDAVIVRGLIAVLHALYAGSTAPEILAVDAVAAMKRLGLDQALSTQRSNGLRAMVERLRETALRAA